MKDKIIIPFDVQTRDEFDYLLKELSGTATFAKVGMELFYRFGPNIIEDLKQHNFKIFLDLKLHDIPNTVHHACKVLGEMEVDILNVHSSGGSEMMQAAREGFKLSHKNGLLIGVTQLTSTTQKIMNSELNISGSVEDSVLSLANMTKESGLDGVVCSAKEVQTIKTALGKDFKCITPGIRPLNYQKDDQKRIMTPTEAIQAGSDYLVIGRPITKADSPKEAYLKILKDISHE